MRARAEGESIRVSVDFDAPIPKEWVGKVGFNLELFPGLLFGKSWQLGKSDGVFQQQPSGPGEVPVLARGKTLEVAPETELYHLTIEVAEGRRARAARRPRQSQQRLVRRARAGAGRCHAPTPSNGASRRMPRRAGCAQPVIQVSQVGYHPAQPKQAIIELDPRDTRRENVKLQRIGLAGQVKTVIDRKPEEWGKFLRYQYARLDFTDVKEPGVYVVRYGSQVSNPFRINAQRVRARGVAAHARILPAGADVPHEGHGEVPPVAWRLPPGRRAHGAGESQPLRRLPAGAVDAD